VVPVVRGLRLYRTAPPRTTLEVTDDPPDAEGGTTMSKPSKEAARAAREAQDVIVTQPRGSKSLAIDEALRRFLSAETYGEQRKHEAESAEDERLFRDSR
jgi:hypothetical protein